jgi:hypothetical protein
MKGHKSHKKEGGKVHENDDMKGEREELHESQKEDFKKGGKVKKHGKHKKHGGKVEGKKAKHRPDKRARGGKISGTASKVESAAGMSPSSPLSGAGKTKEAKTPKLDREDD